MNKIELYNQIFMSAFPFSDEDVKTMSFQNTDGWDSVGQMALVAAIEDGFSVRLTSSEIFAFRSYVSGIEILTQKGIALTV